MTDGPTEAERTILYSFVQTVHDMTKVSQTHVRPDVLADALVAVAVLIVRRLHGPETAAERLRETADAIDSLFPEIIH